MFRKPFDTFSHKVMQTWFVLQESWHTRVLGIYYLVQNVRIEKIVKCFKLRAMFRY